MTVPSPELPSIVTDRYTIEKELGAGGMATVYLALDTKHDRQVALKVLRPELGAVLGADRFLSEIKITARLDHPHILTLIDSGIADGLLYYVLPYVRGESLRHMLNRETQISVDDALNYTKQVASALDYAHRHGVIHRDIKPENILIQEGEAILADFGIALAVKEAGGSRLTETGLSLGTPQYMSPEQATGDRGLDGRSDQYSLAAVLYEMLTGEPPIAGNTAQAVIAKLLTEPPTHIRVIRKTVPESVDAAVMKALGKLPADRFTSAGAFARALESKSATTEAITGASPRARNRKIGMIAAVAAIAVAAAGGATFMYRGKAAPPSAPIALRDRAQLTFTGDIIGPVMSADAKQLAYFKRTCPTENCTYAILVQDVGGTEARQILDGATSEFGMEWSPDRRYLLFLGTIKGRYGVYLVSTLGGAPRLVGSGSTTFYAGGDSLLVAGTESVPDKDSTFTVKVTSLSGDVGGTVKVPGGGRGVVALSSIPGSTRFIAATSHNGQALWQIIDRQGNSTDQILNTCMCGGTASTDAVWMARAGASAGEAIVRVEIDPATGRFAQKQDTLYSGQFTGFAVSSDGTKFVVDDGSNDTNVQIMSLADMRARKFSEVPAIKVSTGLVTMISPDGNRVLKRQVIPDGHGSSQLRLTILPFAGGSETALETDGTVTGGDWIDSVSVGFSTKSAKGTKLTVVDVRNGAHRNDLEVPDLSILAASPLPNGWAFIPGSGDRISIVQNGKRREVHNSRWYQMVVGIAVSPDKSQIMYWGWNVGSNDSLGYETMPVSGGSPVRRFTTFAERGWGSWMNDGSFVARIWETPNAVTLTKIKTDGGTERLGNIPHLATNFSISADMKRATIGWRESHADAYMYRVVKQ